MTTSQIPNLDLAKRHRPKRNQVARACDGCRVQRIKCDNNHPCSNCKARGRACSNDETTRSTTLSQAHDEIVHLKRRVDELEAELQRERGGNQQLTPAASSTQQSSSAEDEDLYQEKINLYQEKIKHAHPRGIQIRPSRAPNESWFGPSSLYYYIYHLSSHLSSKLQQDHMPDRLLPNSAIDSKLLHTTSTDRVQLNPHLDLSRDDPIEKGVYLSAVQEGYFIDFFWETYHTSIFPIINEAEFKTHYQSLWTSLATTRRPSALVDIVVAICMQFGVSKLPTENQGDIAERDDATIAGRWHYRRGRMLLAREAESPSIATLQCHLLSVSYLCGGSFHNMVDTACALAVRTAHLLGLQIDTSEDISDADRQMRRRLWWTVYTVDSKVGMKLGRPFLVDDSYIMPRMPEDDFQAAMQSGSSFAPVAHDTTWLSFSTQQTKLYAEVRAAHNSLYRMALSGMSDLNDLKSLEKQAVAMSPHTEKLDDWAARVPYALKMRFQNGEPAFLMGGDVLDIEQFAPVWLQRQRVLLLLTYHHLCVNLYRPFISFAQAAPAARSQAGGIVIRCANHAISLTKATHQILTTTSILSGWHESFQWQWSAAMTLVGFVLMYPQESMAPIARSALDLAIAVFDVFGASFHVAAAAAKIMRDLCGKIDFVGARDQPKHAIFAGEVPSTFNSIAPRVSGDQEMHEFSMMGEDLELQDFQPWSATEGGSGLFDMALDIDFWADLDIMWPDAGISSQAQILV